MGIFQDVKDIKETLNNVTKDLFYKAKKYDELVEQLSKLKINVKRVSLIISDDYTHDVKIEYEIPDVIIKTNQLVTENHDLFASINKLNLISISDMNKISKKIEEAKLKNGD